MADRRRPRCPACLRALRTCICPWVRPVANQVRLLILQHPNEARHVKGSARLLHLSLTHSQLEVGEHFSPEQLATWLGTAPEQSMLLYPATGAGSTFTVVTSERPAPRQLVVLDGTWRKSLKLLHGHPRLQALPRLALPARPATSCYAGLRKAPQPHQLSTLEACCHALADLEAAPERYAPLLHAFSQFVSEQLRHGPCATATTMRP